MRRFLLCCSLVGLLVACATSPTGRKQLMIMPESQMNTLGAQSFDQLKTQTPADTDPRNNAFVKCVAGAITAAARGQTSVDQWEVVVFRDAQVNAFALPGGKIGVYTGILPVTRTDAQLAAVLGHEVGHVIAKHGAERVSDQLGAQLVLAGVGAATGGDSKIMALLGAGAQVGILLPFSRTQESEADLIGEDLMARAGFDPAQSIELWKNMSAASGGKAPPAILSTHPANQDRIANLTEHLGPAQEKYRAARAAGVAPNCAHP